MVKGKAKDVDNVKEKESGKEEKKEEKKRSEVRRDIPQLIIRVAGTDLDGEKSIMRALRKIKGISVVTSKAICLAAKIDPSVKLGKLSESEIATVESVIKNPVGFGVPIFIINRRSDLATGENLHLTSSDLDISRRFDVQRYIDLRTYRGWRHMLGQPVRGQRTRSTFRSSGKSVGVMKKAVQTAAAPPAAGAPVPAAKPAEKPAKK